MGMPMPQIPIPPIFKALVRWLKDRRGMDLYGRTPKFTTSFYVGNEEVTPEFIKAIKDNLASAPAELKETRRPKNKTPTE